ncbi:MAG: hypothetical protein ACD_3C00192G0002 [uncultured bacterium (gcode 4)]|uniref:EamA domain-containing protein n=1 Tax=uncultured bacterium (gcode 4) TaxID=1234023 RepID=K2G073_9BACT|nr:MAG: hypothetical protein ACD_3C00192G0002 [uncultured bacterium (gcode 4)]
MIYALLGTLSYAIANTLIKYVSLNFNLYKSMFFQYIFVSFFGFLLVTFFDSYKFDMLWHLPLFTIIAVWGFFGIWWLMKWMQHLNSWVNFVVANMYVVLAYFVNNYLFPGIETFTVAKILTALLFFIIVSVLLFEKNEDKKIRFNSKIIFSIIAAIGWTIYSTSTNFAVKTWVITPFQGMFYCELSITLIVIMVYLGNSMYNKKFDFKISAHHLFSNMLVSFFIFAWAVWFFVWFSKTLWNYVNIIWLAQIPTLAILSFIFLKDRMTKLQISTVAWALAVLILFMIV